jgi:hypothetical protein
MALTAMVTIPSIKVNPICLDEVGRCVVTVNLQSLMNWKGL